MTERRTLAHEIDGRAVAGPAALFQDNPADPADLRVEVPEAGEALVDEAIAAACNALDPLDRHGIEWRAAALAAMARILLARAAALAELIAREPGQLLADSRTDLAEGKRLAVRDNPGGVQRY